MRRAFQVPQLRPDPRAYPQRMIQPVRPRRFGNHHPTMGRGQRPCTGALALDSRICTKGKLSLGTLLEGTIEDVVRKRRTPWSTQCGGSCMYARAPMVSFKARDQRTRSPSCVPPQTLLVDQGLSRRSRLRAPQAETPVARRLTSLPRGPGWQRMPTACGPRGVIP
jgi:hypothetical protein